MWNDDKFDLTQSNWNYRIERMLSYLKGYDDDYISSFMDCGAGGQHLKKYISDKSKYIPVDHTNKWGKDVIIRDFNNGEFYDVMVDCIFLSGILEYILNPGEFIDNVCKHSNKIVLLSYNTTDVNNNISERESFGWNCHLSNKQIVDMFKKNKFRVRINEKIVDNVENYFLFEKESIDFNIYKNKS